MTQERNLMNSSKVVSNESLSLFEIANGKRVFIKEHGEKFYEIKENPQAQQVVARILKGIISVADIVKINQNYYSYQPDLKLLNTHQNIEKEIDSDLLVLRLIFSDRDHRLKWKDVKYINVNVLENNKYYIYDLGKANQFWIWNYDVFPHRIEGILNKRSKDTLDSLTLKLNNLLTKINSIEGLELLQNILKSSNNDLNILFPPAKKDTEYSLEEFKNEVVRRINFVLEKINPKLI